MKRLLLTVVLCLPLCVSAAVEKKDLDLKASDGVPLKATYYSPGKSGPGMLLLHQCNMDRKSWDSLATALAEKGIHVMTLDYRGYGESGGQTNDRDEQRRMRAKWPDDVDVAFAVLQAQKGVDKKRLAAGGASCGVNQSVQLARRSGAVKALVLLSGGSNDEGVEFLKSSDIPVFAAVSQEEERIVEFMRAVTTQPKNAATRLQVLTGAGHGVPMFDKDTGLRPAIANWVVQNLK